MARWKVYDGDQTLSCTHCGMVAPHARYRRKNGINALDITDYCPHCGAKMTGIDECYNCCESKDGNWQDNGICFACRGTTWLPGRRHNE